MLTYGTIMLWQAEHCISLWQACVELLLPDICDAAVLMPTVVMEG